MKNNFEKYFESEIKKMGWDLPEMLRFIFYDMLFFKATDYYDASIQYNKKYFADYYNVDVQTFNNWVKLFCPKTYSGNYKAKRKFNRAEFEEIIECIGQCNKSQMRPYKRNEIATILYSDQGWSTSKMYRELKNELSKMYPKLEPELKILPPNIANSLLKEFLDRDLSQTVLSSQTNYTRELLEKKMFELLKKKKKMSAQERIKERKETMRYVIGELQKDN